MPARQIRPLQTADLAAQQALLAQLNPDDPPLPPAQAAAIWQQMLAMPGLVCLGVFAEGALLASCVLHVLPNLSRGGRPYALIENVVTARAARRSGHGRALLEAACSRAWAAGCYKAMLLTGRKDEAVSAFYTACGFAADDKRGFVARPPR